MIPLRQLPCALLLLLPSLAASPQTAQTAPLRVDEAGARLSFTPSALHLDLPLSGANPAAAVQLTADLLNPQDEVKAHGSATCAISAAPATCHLTLPTDTPIGTGSDQNLALFRVRYIVAAPAQPPVTGILALERIAPTLFQLQASAPRTIRPGGAYTVRLRATHPLTGAPQPGVPLHITASASFANRNEDKDFLHKSILTDRRGFATLEFTAPSDPALESVTLDATGKLASAEIEVEQTLNVRALQSLALTTDKPLYQPGQTVHLRTLALDRTGQAKPSLQVDFDVKDPDSTLVYRAHAVTSKFGIASVDWPIASRLRLGNYSIVATTESSGTTATSVRVSRYDLPTFTVAPKPDKPFYLPGQNAAVNVRANYLFGKPVLHGHVRVVRESERHWNFEKQRYDTQEGASVPGELGPDGSFTAPIDLAGDEKQLVGDDSPDFQDLHLAAYVTDASTGRTEQARFDLRISQRPAHVAVVRETAYVAGLPNGFTVVATSADGLPLPDARVRIALLPHASAGDKETLDQRIAHAVSLKELRTNPYGLARVDGLPLHPWLVEHTPPALTGTPEDEDVQPELLVEVQTATGSTGRTTETLAVPTALLRVTADRTLYKPGDPIRITVESARQGLPVTIQLLRDLQNGSMTLATENLVIENGHATTTIPTGARDTPDPRFTGPITITAVALGIQPQHTPGTNPEASAAASRTVLFPRDNSLHVKLKMDRETYRPGETASASVDVSGPQDPDGELREPARVALGAVAIDQAVTERDRSDHDFGSGGFFFPWRLWPGGYGSVAGLTSADLMQLPPDKPFPVGVDLAASVLMNSGWRENPAALADDAPNRNLPGVYSKILDAQLKPVREALQTHLKTNPDAPTDTPALDQLLASSGLSISALRDPWGMPYCVTTGTNYNNLTLSLVSDGPDKQPGTADDLTLWLTGWSWFARHQAELQRVLRNVYGRSHRFLRTLDELQAAMASEGIADFAGWRDPWGQPITWTFSIDQAYYTVTAMSAGEPPKTKRRTTYPFAAGSASMPWFQDNRNRVQQALNAYTAAHAFPMTEPALTEALAAQGITLDALRDPWGHSVYPVFRTRSLYTDRVTVEARGPMGTVPRKHIDVTPITAVVETLDLRSMGPHGLRDDSNFAAASFSHVRTQQASQDVSAKPTSSTGHPTPDQTGGLVGVVTDPTGATIPRASLTATNTATQAEFTTETTDAGEYRFDQLPAGLYTLRLDSPGFLRTVIDKVLILPPDTLELNVTLQVGAASETVTVEASAVTLNTESSMMALSGSAGGVLGGIGRRAIQLPLNGRNSMSLLGTMPGVVNANSSDARGLGTPHLREYFPETLLWYPEILTDPDGHATLRFPVADTITAWQLSIAASTRQGNVGGGTTRFTTMLPFFAALDPPQVLTVGDRIALPVALRNYLDHPVSVRTEWSAASWFRLDKTSGPTEVPAQGSATTVAELAAIAPVKDGLLRLTAIPGGAAGDAIERPVSVHPDGLEDAAILSGLVGERATFELAIPSTALAPAETRLKFYPNLGAHLRDALVGMAVYPNGCAEQILSIAWPSLLLQRYAASLPHPDPKIAAETKWHLEEAYANLLADRAANGGFRYWTADQAPDLALTAYAVEFLTAAKPYLAVDEDVVTRAVDSLARQQTPASLWVRVDRAGKPHPEDTIANTMLTASIAAMIAPTPGTEPLVTKALAAVQPFVDLIDEPYTLANYALAALAAKDTARSRPAIARLATLARPENDGAYWVLETNTPFFGWGRAGRVETTALAVQALLRSGLPAGNDLVTRGMLFLDHERDRQSLWYSTQATARALDALAAVAFSGGAPAVTRGGVLTVKVDGAPAASTTLPPSDRDEGPVYLDLPQPLAAGHHTLELAGPAGMAPATAQIVANYYRPWPASDANSAATGSERLTLQVGFDRQTAAPGTPIHVAAHIERIGFRGYGMLIAEIGLPPGADVDRASLETAMADSGYVLNHYEVLPDRLLVYLWPQAGGYDLHFQFSLRYAMDALTAPSSVYDYYNPDARFDLKPVRFKVR